MSTSVNLRDLITQQASAQGVPPDIALSVAQTESGIAQWKPNGQVVTSPVGALGVFQLMPATAAGLGVDPTDVTQNIQGGIAYLKQLYQKYGSWEPALAAYNWGPGKVDNALASGGSIPGQVMGYVKSVLNRIGQAIAPGGPMVASGPVLTADDILSSVDTSNAPLIAVGAIVGLAVVAWYISD